MVSMSTFETIVSDDIGPSPRATAYHFSSSASSPSPPSSESSHSSIFSVDAASQSSESSVGSLHVPFAFDDAWRREQELNQEGGSQGPHLPSKLPSHHRTRQHPRRCSSSHCPPPSLLRQSEKKGQFVDHLVDSAAQMVEVIWPLSAPACHGESGYPPGVLPLRTFIQETLKRSRTSFSTLQVALYYLILVKVYLPKVDFTMEQPEDSPLARALQCGRRMFLSALILASKYLQDRNYSARAWSKISGLKVTEINTNEMAFLDAVDWKLHIPEPLFERWQSILINYTAPARARSWKEIVAKLTPRLDFGSTAEFQRHTRPSLVTPLAPTPIPAVLGPAVSNSKILPPPPPPLRRYLLPTPTMTPQTFCGNTPAASFAAHNTQRQPSMCSAMAFAQNAMMARSVMDCHAFPKPNGLDAYRVCSRRPSAVSASSASSPDSMISDNSQWSRSSSISSQASISPINTTSNLARLAALRSAGLPLQREKSWKDGEPVVRITNGPLTTEPACASPELEIIDLDAPTNPPPCPKESLTPSPVRDAHKRKRGRSSIDMSLQEHVQNMLKNSSMSVSPDRTAVRRDSDVAKSFVMDGNTRLPGVRAELKSVAWSFPVDKKQVAMHGGRKKARCFGEVDPSTAEAVVRGYPVLCCDRFGRC